MAKSAIITLTTAGTNTGPFNLLSDVDGYVTPFETNIAKASLVVGYTTNLVPNAATIIRVQSLNSLCTNFIDIVYPTTTTTSTTTSTTTIPPTTTTTSTTTSTTTIPPTTTTTSTTTISPTTTSTTTSTTTIPPTTTTTSTTTSTTTAGSTSYQVRYESNLALICSETPFTVYIISTGTFNTGATVYTDAALTIPLSGNIYISEVLSATIWNINSSTGLIGSSTGNSC